jgi:glycosyltransferase involved in cell wall biosynthesis
MTPIPRLGIGLPVYNGENYLAEAIEALLGQTYPDFELIIGDNASTDGTEEICRQYAARDPRIRYFRQPRNIGLAPNHGFVFRQSRSELFKWACHDDLFGRDLLRRCVDALDEHPHVVAANAWTAMIDGTGAVTRAIAYPLATSSPSAAERFRSMLFANGGDDDGAVFRSEVLRRVKPLGSYHHADRTFVTELALQGPFHQVPDWLYFRRDHPERAERACPTVRTRCANLDPRRADRIRHPVARLLGEYVWAYVSMIRRAPLTAAERRECHRALAQWAASRATRDSWGEVTDQPAAEVDLTAMSVAQVVAGQESKTRGAV